MKDDSLKDLLTRHGFRFSKSMGQNFLTDRNILSKTASSSGVDDTFAILEIGPGAGALTRELSSIAGRVVAVELDGRLIPLLGDALSGLTNTEVVNADVLKLDIAALMRDKAPGMRYAVCANLPYNITTPVLTKIIECGIFESATVMVQREVARRICAAPATPDYGAFTVYVNYHAAVKTLFDVAPDCFLPKPKVVSSVVRFELLRDRALPPEREVVLSRVVRGAFSQRRKTLANALSASTGVAKSDIEQMVESCGFDPRARGETLSPGDFIKLTDALCDSDLKIK